jgi:hypothetical protein
LQWRGKNDLCAGYLTTDYFKTPPRFLNADEIARGLSPLAPQSVALKAGKLLLSEIDACLRGHKSFAIESTLSGHSQIDILKHAASLGYRIENILSVDSLLRRRHQTHYPAGEKRRLRSAQGSFRSRAHVAPSKYLFVKSDSKDLPTTGRSAVRHDSAFRCRTV